MLRLVLLLTGVLSALLVTGCLPGGVIAPIPFPHNDRPTVHGILHEDGMPVEGMRIRAASFDNHYTAGPEACEDYQAEATTNFRGEFEIRGDKDLFTIWWDAGGYGPNTLALCVPEAGERAVWTTWLERKGHPPWLQSDIALTCGLNDNRTVLRCVVSEEEEAQASQ